MPQTYSYPGVYIEEIASGVRTITGVPTSIAAFVGRARRGPVDEPTTITTYGEFVRIFGGLWVESSLAYAVGDFFKNGGGRAVIVRVFAGLDDDSTASTTIGTLQLLASSPGVWANQPAQGTSLPRVLRIRIDHDEVRAAHLFNLSVALVENATATRPGTVLEQELHRNLSMHSSDVRRVDRVLAASSKLLRVSSDVAFTDTTSPPAAHSPIAASLPLWADNTTSTAVTGGADGNPISSAEVTASGLQASRRGMYALERTDIFNLLCIPPYIRGASLTTTDIDAATEFCLAHRAFFIIDPPSSWSDARSAVDNRGDAGTANRNAAVYFPNLRQPDPERENQLDEFAPCGAIAGVMARTDSERGVWKAPAGLAATLSGVPALSVALTDGDIGQLNPYGTNCLRAVADVGRVVWGSRTREGADALGSEWKYVPVRRLTLFIEESLYRGTQWVVFEPNDEPLWASIRLNVGAFMHSLFRQGAFQGASAREAYEVKCDSETTTQDDINRGIVNIVVRFAPLKPAEFVVIKIQQLAGQVQA